MTVFADNEILVEWLNSPRSKIIVEVGGRNVICNSKGSNVQIDRLEEVSILSSEMDQLNMFKTQDAFLPA